ncbi:MAG: UDP-N-acetylglucosamine 1-carboxyvinyltransferase [Acutalibacteraceae bacterium]
MEKLVINGASPLKGEVTISGAKNAALAIITATVLSEGDCRIENVPDIADVHSIISILHETGADIKFLNKSTVVINTRGIRTHVVPYSLTKLSRGSCYFMGAMLGRFSKAQVAPPGGCNFGVRPIDLHTKGFRLLGADVEMTGGMVDIKADRLIGASIYMDNVSVGATINIILAAVKAEGMTVIDNAAKEPHIVDLANFLNSMGADIRGAGTDVIKIYGVKSLHGTNYSIIPDQIEAGTYMAAAAATHGDVLVKNVIPKHMEAISTKLEEAGVTIIESDDSIRVISNGALRGCSVRTMPHPGFPTDMQPQITTLLTAAEGTSIVNELIFDNRFQYVDYLTAMGAKIKVNGHTAVIEGVDRLVGAPVKAVDLRAGAAMIIAGLMAEGTTEIENIHIIDRGYENYVEKLTALGANIRRVTVDDEPADQAGAV